jgi:hypothetical protein
MEVKIGDAVEYVDEIAQSHKALITAVHGSTVQTDNGPRHPAVNLIYVTDDTAKTDPYGRQVERQTSAVHEASQSAAGRYWKFL